MDIKKAIVAAAMLGAKDDRILLQPSRSDIGAGVIYSGSGYVSHFACPEIDALEVPITLHGRNASNAVKRTGAIKFEVDHLHGIASSITFSGPKSSEAIPATPCSVPWLPKLPAPEHEMTKSEWNSLLSAINVVQKDVSRPGLDCIQINQIGKVFSTTEAHVSYSTHEMKIHENMMLRGNTLARLPKLSSTVPEDAMVYWSFSELNALVRVGDESRVIRRVHDTWFPPLHHLVPTTLEFMSGMSLNTMALMKVIRLFKTKIERTVLALTFDHDAGVVHVGKPSHPHAGSVDLIVHNLETSYQTTVDGNLLLSLVKTWPDPHMNILLDPSIPHSSIVLDGDNVRHIFSPLIPRKDLETWKS